MKVMHCIDGRGTRFGERHRATGVSATAQSHTIFFDITCSRPLVPDLHGSHRPAPGRVPGCARSALRVCCDSPPALTPILETRSRDLSAVLTRGMSHAVSRLAWLGIVSLCNAYPRSPPRGSPSQANSDNTPAHISAVHDDPPASASSMEAPKLHPERVRRVVATRFF